MYLRLAGLPDGKLPAFFYFSAMLACLGLSGCGFQTPLPDTARAPPGAFGSNGDEDVAAINLASWAFSSSRNLRNRPIEAARAVAAVDYLAGELASNPRWLGVSPFVQMEMLQARTDVRNTMGIAPDARSQLVVNSLARYAASLAENGDQAAAAQYITNPAFTLGPVVTEARLQALPFSSTANVATQRALGSISGGGDSSSNLP